MKKEQTKNHKAIKEIPFNRLNEALLLKDLKSKIVLLMGPRQTGKTWLAKKVMKKYKRPVYLNFDSFEHKKIIQEQSWLESADLLVFDELHKMDQWKSYIKGVFDTRPSHQSVLVTGSARLQQMSRAGDSLAGRCFFHTLLPFSFFELKQTHSKAGFKKLLNSGGFPEPLLLLKDKTSREKWRRQYMSAVLREDIPDFNPVQNYKKMETLLYLLREKVGSPVSINSLAEDLKLDYKTVSKYISVLEDLFVVFQIPTFSKNISRSLSKPKKVYFFDFAFVEEQKGRLENLTALHLLKYCSYWQDKDPSQGLSLFYLRTKDQREVDFLLTKKARPYLMIENKTKDSAFSKNLIYFHDQYGIPGKQLALNLKTPKQIRGKNISSERLEDFLLNLKT